MQHKQSDDFICLKYLIPNENETIFIYYCIYKKRNRGKIKLWAVNTRIVAGVYKDSLVTLDMKKINEVAFLNYNKYVVKPSRAFLYLYLSLIIGIYLWIIKRIFKNCDI